MSVPYGGSKHPFRIPILVDLCHPAILMGAIVSGAIGTKLVRSTSVYLLRDQRFAQSCWMLQLENGLHLPEPPFFVDHLPPDAGCTHHAMQRFEVQVLAQHHMDR